MEHIYVDKTHFVLCVIWGIHKKAKNNRNFWTAIEYLLIFCLKIKILS